MPSRMSPLLRSAIAFLLLPGVVGFAIPVALLVVDGQLTLRLTPTAAAGGLVGLAGVAGLLWCVTAFHTIGNGTLAPWDPARRLVRVGLYSLSRNPMYISVLLILVGWALVFGSWPLTLYTAIVAVAFHLRVVLAEEPALARAFGDEWLDYRAVVPRWLGRRGARA